MMLVLIALLVLQISVETITCNGHTITLNTTNSCLSNEDTLFVDGYWINCNPQLNSYSDYAMTAINAFCNHNVTVLRGLPAPKVLCYGHTITFGKGASCLSDEYVSVIDSIDFGCVKGDDTYLFPFMNAIDAVCDGNDETFRP